MPRKDSFSNLACGLLYGAAIAVFCTLLAVEIGSAVKSNTPQETKSASVGFDLGGIYALLLWVVIPLTIFGIHQWRSSKRFRALVEARSRKLRRDSRASDQEEAAPLVRAKVDSEEPVATD